MALSLLISVLCPLRRVAAFQPRQVRKGTLTRAHPNTSAHPVAAPLSHVMRALHPGVARSRSSSISLTSFALNKPPILKRDRFSQSQSPASTPRVMFRNLPNGTSLEGLHVSWRRRVPVCPPQAVNSQDSTPFGYKCTAETDREANSRINGLTDHGHVDRLLASNLVADTLEAHSNLRAHRPQNVGLHPLDVPTEHLCDSQS